MWWFMRGRREGRKKEKKGSFASPIPPECPGAMSTVTTVDIPISREPLKLKWHMLCLNGKIFSG